MKTLFEKYISRLPAQGKKIVRSEKQIKKKFKVAFDVESYAYQIFGVNLMRIPGINEGSLLKLTGELGHDFTEKFDTYKKFCRWENLAPNNTCTLYPKGINTKYTVKLPVVRLFQASCPNEKIRSVKYLEKLQLPSIGRKIL